jgi:hypothetical protein
MEMDSYVCKDKEAHYLIFTIGTYIMPFIALRHSRCQLLSSQPCRVFAILQRSKLRLREVRNTSQGSVTLTWVSEFEVVAWLLSLYPHLVQASSQGN